MESLLLLHVGQKEGLEGLHVRLNGAVETAKGRHVPQPHNTHQGPQQRVHGERVDLGKEVVQPRVSVVEARPAGHSPYHVQAGQVEKSVHLDLVVLK